jgi:hypothetical protein
MVPSKASPQVPNPSPAASGKRLAGAAANVVAGTKRRAAPGVEEDPNADGAVDPDTLIDPDMGHDGGEEHLPADQQISAPGGRKPGAKPMGVAPARPASAAAGYAHAARAGMYGAPQVPAPVDLTLPVEDEGSLPEDPEERKKEENRRLSKRKTEAMKLKCEPLAPSVLNISQRRCAPAVKLANLNPALCGLDDSKPPKQATGKAMYFVTHTYAGRPGPTVQVEGRLVAQPMVSATYDSTNFTIEILDPLEQRNWSGMSRQFKKNFETKAVEKKWPFAGQMIKKMAFRDFYVRGKIMDETLRKKYVDPDMLPTDMVDQETKQVIECYPPRIKAQLVMSKKIRDAIDTDAMDENDVQMNPFHLKRGNLVRMAIRMHYAYYKAVPGQPVNEYGVPCKLALIKRLDQYEEVEGAPVKRTKWADPDEPATHTAPQVPGVQAQVAAPATPAVPAQPQVGASPVAAAAVPQVPGAPEGSAEALAESVLGPQGAALRQAVREQAQAAAPPAADTKIPEA